MSLIVRYYLQSTLVLSFYIDVVLTLSVCIRICCTEYIFTFLFAMLFWNHAPSIGHTKLWNTIYPKKYAHGFCFAVLCCGYTLTDCPISIRLTSLAPWQSNDCPSASKATLMNMDKYFMWIHYERLHNHNKAKHNKTVCRFLRIYCMFVILSQCKYCITAAASFCVKPCV